MKINNEVEVSFNNNKSFKVERKEKINGFLDEIYNYLENNKIILSAKDERENFSSIIYSINGEKKKLKATSIYDKDENPSLRELGLNEIDHFVIYNEETVYKNEGGGAGGNALQDLTDLNVVHRQFNPDAQSYRKIIHGINGEGICKNKLCKANGKEVLNKLTTFQDGYGIFDIIKIRKGEFLCPTCEKPIFKIINFYFYLCNYKWTGLCANDDNKLVPKSREGKASNQNGPMRFEIFKEVNNFDFHDYKFEITELN